MAATPGAANHAGWVGASPAEAEADAAQVGDDLVDKVAPPAAALEVDVELGELQLHVADVMEEEDQDTHIVVPVGQGGQRLSG